MSNALEPYRHHIRDDQANARRVETSFWSTLKRVARNVPFVPDLLAAYFCAMDPMTPPRVRAVLIGALAYFVLPFDAIPDLLPGLGFTDDLTVLLAALGMARVHVTDAHREKAAATLADEPDLRA